MGRPAIPTYNVSGNLKVKISWDIIGPDICITEDIGGTVYLKVVQTEEECVRQALIRLGWTPPKDAV